MNNSLNDYIIRTNEIVNNFNQSIKKQQKINEFRHMIFNIESALTFIKNQFKKIANEPDEEIVENPKFIKSVNITSLNALNTFNKINLGWVSEINQYTLKINNLVLRGNIGNIYDSKILLNDRIQAHQVVICSKGNNCSNILSNQYCKFFHDPMDLLELKNNKIISDQFYQNCIKLTRNFSSTSWIYSTDVNRKSNMRCIGSKSTIDYDIACIKTLDVYKTNIENMKQQVMHDLLILLKLSECNLTG
jgi:hypothetical protein